MMKKNRLVTEREIHRIPIDKLKVYLAGGDKNYDLYQRALKIVLEHPELRDIDFNFHDRARGDQRKITLERIVNFQKLSVQISDPELMFAVFKILSSINASFGVRYGVHIGLFGGSILGQGTDEQIAEYYPRVLDMSLYGCFCMTELGTGSYLQSLETTATYFHDSDEIEIHTPTLTATKWWIGAAAQTATHAIVLAKLILEGKDLGTHNFIVQLRDEEFNLCKGISIGDVGPKRGDEGIDNGWVRFDHVRIPRKQMLMKWNRITPDGVYEKSDRAQLAYGALISGRVSIARGVTDFAKRAITISMRYCTVRDQFSLKGKSLLDYTIQQERLIGGMASAYAFHFATDYLSEMYLKVNNELMNKNTSNLKNLHNLSAGLKGISALWANDAINQCIFSMGGHGYSKLSGLPSILNDFAPSIPYEGDAIVMVQQTAAYLVKSLGAVLSGEELAGEDVQYLKNVSKINEMRSSVDPEKELSLQELLDAAEWLSLLLVRNSAIELQSSISENNNQEESWNSNQISLIAASKAHVMYMVINIFKNTLDNRLPEALRETAPQLLPLLTQVAQLFALRHLQEFLTYFIENNYFPSSRGNLIRKQIVSLYKALRPISSQLVDAWGIHDIVLGTPLGRFDGDIYTHYFKAVNDSLQDIKPEYWEEYLKPFFEQKKRAA